LEDLKKMVKKYKVLKEDLKSPYEDFQYEIGQTYVCPDFDESDEECSRGFYATDLEGLPYTFRKGRMKVFEVEMGGKERKFNQYKHRWETQTILREIPEGEIRELLEKESSRVGYNLLGICFPLNPLTDVEHGEVTDVDIENLKKWSSIRASVGDSVGDSVRASVGDSVGDSVWASVRDSVWASVWVSVWASIRDSVRASVRDSVGDSVRASVGAYISSIFPNIKKWEGIGHEEGVNPFQSGIDLWNRGLVPSFDGINTWRLHAGKDAKVVYEWKNNLNLWGNK
jgi:hypothetical protein